MSSPTIGVQSIRRAFAVLRALADGPLGVSEVAIASRIPKRTSTPSSIPPIACRDG